MRRRRPNFARQFYRQVDVGPRPSIWPKVGGFLLLVLVGTAVWWVGWSPFWRVDEVLVRGVPDAQATALASSFDLAGQNIFRLKMAEVEKVISQQPTIADYEIVRQLPHRLIIDLKERQPILVWRTISRSWLVDSTGRVIKEQVEAVPDKPVVVDSANIAVNPGTVAVPMSFLRTLALLEERLPKLYGAPMKEYEVGETIFDLDAVAADGRRIRFNTLGDVAAQLTDLERLATQRTDLFSRSVIDLRVDRWAYVK